MQRFSMGMIAGLAAISGSLVGALGSAVGTWITQRFEGQRDLVGKLLEKLSPEDRTLLLLKEVEGHSVEELSQMTGMNENTIKVKLFRARQKLLKVAQRLTRGAQSLA